MLWEFPKREGLNRLRKFTGQGTCSHIHSEVFLGNMRFFWDSVVHSQELSHPHAKMIFFNKSSGVSLSAVVTTGMMYGH
jgi:hypothetical protein